MASMSEEVDALAGSLRAVLVGLVLVPCPLVLHLTQPLLDKGRVADPTSLGLLLQI